MKIILANPRGFCAGVNMAIQTVEEALSIVGAPLYVYHEIVHNRHVVQHFVGEGVVFVDSIDDVPVTEYFSGSIALHGAFWHERFGLRRSHGCVNLSPHDARRVWSHTLPAVEAGWHGVSTDKTGQPASKVYITER